MTKIVNDMYQMIHDYLMVYLPKQRCSSQHTIKSCRTAINQLLDHIAAGKNVSLNELTFEDLNQENLMGFLDYLTENRGLAAATRNQRLACIRGFMSYAATRRPELIAQMNSLAMIPGQKEYSDTGIDYLSAAAMRALLSEPDTTKKKGIRDQFFMVLMYDTGARIQEMLRLKICDIRLGTTPTATLMGKGSKIRTVPLMKDTIDHFRRYMSVYHPTAEMLSGDDLFYVVQHGEKKPMSDDNVRRFLKVYASSAKEKCPEVPDNVHPHLFRHSRAMHLYQAGMDLTLVSQWLGHAQLESTLVYAHADTEQKRAAIEKANGSDLLRSLSLDKAQIMKEDDLLRKLCGLM